MAAAEQMTPEQRQAFIESMVERLAAKMKEEPENLEGWIRLANAYGVLEKREEARAAWAEAAKRAPSRLDVQLDYAGALIQGRTDLAKTVPAEFPEAVKRIRTLDPDESARPVLRRRGGARRRPAGRGEGAVGEGSGSDARRLAGAPAAAARDRYAGQAGELKLPLQTSSRARSEAARPRAEVEAPDGLRCGAHHSAHGSVTAGALVCILGRRTIEPCDRNSFRSWRCSCWRPAPTMAAAAMAAPRPIPPTRISWRAIRP